MTQFIWQHTKPKILKDEEGKYKVRGQDTENSFLFQENRNSVSIKN